jgi:NADH-quinone oxidoreductase subunit M
MFGEVTNPANRALRDLNLRELVTLVPLAVWCFWIGIYPKPYFEILEKPVEAIVRRVEAGPPPAPLEVPSTPTEASQPAREPVEAVRSQP